MITDKEIIVIIEEVMELDLSKLDFNSNLDSISEWDSFNNLMLISRFQEEFDVEFNAIEIENTNTISGIIDLVKNKVN